MQQGMSGTAIVYGNGSSKDAMDSFPPSDEVLRDSFMAVFTGPERENVIVTAEQQEEQARAAMRREVELHVEKGEYEMQAAFLVKHNYKYKEVAEERAGYRQDLVDKLPSTRSLPTCLEACAKFVPDRSDAVDSTKATGPSTSTTAAQQEMQAAEHDAEELDKWISMLDEKQDEVEELTSLPALQGLLERMESLAGRVVANELQAISEENGYGALDDLGE